MPNRIYLLVALAFIIGAPLIVTTISDALPTSNSAETTAEVQTDTPAPTEVAAEPEATPPVETVEMEPGSTEPLFDASPAVDVDALAVRIPGDPPPPPPAPPQVRAAQGPAHPFTVGPDDIDPAQHQ
ncbi:MAG: hypothetical protein KKD64_00135 [Alphaproteobacteria bacterium]|jgi:U5 snRNP spliceosome subunit|nr:hypothetical protein [Alphaproteobacteria bacterium]MBU0792345.1 hypothetical protein [Alphaproteobacteria bacterium]MBU0874617.1 hypothetical protein [Alphaproteobacteria bacterium]MBU1768047.1 hypothetical protein [Alphaproteobacteria bacterium]